VYRPGAGHVLGFMSVGGRHYENKDIFHKCGTVTTCRSVRLQAVGLYKLVGWLQQRAGLLQWHSRRRNLTGPVMPFPSHLQTGWSAWCKGQQPLALSYIDYINLMNSLNDTKSWWNIVLGITIVIVTIMNYKFVSYSASQVTISIKHKYMATYTFFNYSHCWFQLYYNTSAYAYVSDRQSRTSSSWNESPYTIVTNS